MIEQLGDAPTGVIAFKAVGKVEAHDYESVLRPAIEAAVAEGGKIRIVFELGSRVRRLLGGGRVGGHEAVGPASDEVGALRGRHGSPADRGCDQGVQGRDAGRREGVPRRRPGRGAALGVGMS